MTPNGQTNGNGNGNLIRDPISPGSNEALDYKYGKYFYKTCATDIKKLYLQEDLMLVLYTLLTRSSKPKYKNPTIKHAKNRSTNIW